MRCVLAVTLLKFLALLPRAWLQFLGRQVGRASFHANSRSRRITEANLEVCFPLWSEGQRRKLALDSLVMTGQTLFEIPAIWFRKPEVTKRWIVSISNESLLDDAISTNRGVIVVLPHLGNWELFNAYFYGRRESMTALFQPPEKSWQKSVVERGRKLFGNRMVATNRRGISSLYRTLGRGGIVTILPDQVPESGVYAPFFGVQALTDTLTSRLARKTGARIVTAVVLRRADGLFEVRFARPDPGVYSRDVEQSVAAVNRTVEACAGEWPEQYQWEYKRFRKRPSGEEKLYRFNKPVAWH